MDIKDTTKIIADSESGSTDDEDHSVNFQDEFETELTQNNGPGSNNDDDYSTELHSADTMEVTETTLDGALSKIGFGMFHVKMIILAGGGYFAICTEMLVIVFLSDPITAEFKISKDTFSWLPFATSLSAIIGGIILGNVSDRCGRQIPFISSIGLCGIFGLVSTFSPNFPLLVLFRLLVSFGIGGLTAVDFVLILEFLPKRNRGVYMVIITFCGALGVILAAGVAWLVIPTHGWRLFVGVCVSPTIIIFVLRLVLRYESPRYLFVSGKYVEGMAVLKQMAKQNGAELPPDMKILRDENYNRGNILDLFKASLRWNTSFLTVVWFLQSCGYWGVTVYLPDYISRFGVNPYFNMLTVFIAEIPGLFLAMIFIENHMFGRLVSLRIFTFFTCVSLVAFAFIHTAAPSAVVAVCCYFFMVPIYAILNTYTPETYPTDLRSTAMAWVNIIIGIPGMITPFISETLLSSTIKWLYPIVWASVFFLLLTVSFGLRNDTANKTLKDVHVHKNNVCENTV